MTFEDCEVGMKARFERCIAASEVDEFARLSGDYNPLHTDSDFARRSGFRDRVVHGALLVAMISRMIGMDLPGRQSLLLSLKLDFAAPTFPDEKLEVMSQVQSLHPNEQAVVLSLRVTCAGETRARGSALVKVQS